MNLSLSFIRQNSMFAVDCQWSSFGNWSACSETCGGGYRYSERYRTQSARNGGEECTGDYGKIEPCNMNTCPGIYL